MRWTRLGQAWYFLGMEPFEFSFYRPRESIEKSWRFLPHWEQSDVCYFLTFRTMDSIPKEVMQAWLAERRSWLRARSIDGEHEDWHSLLEGLSAEDRQEFHALFSRRMHEFLDECAGECLLKDEKLREIVVSALRHFHGSRYQLGGFVVMPNHVHVLMQCLGEHRMKAQVTAWKRYSARCLHEALGRKGHFWLGETYDHIVRSREQFEHYQRYMIQNPVKAKLREDEVTVWMP